MRPEADRSDLVGPDREFDQEPSVHVTPLEQHVNPTVHSGSGEHGPPAAWLDALGRFRQVELALQFVRFLRGIPRADAMDVLGGLRQVLEFEHDRASRNYGGGIRLQRLPPVETWRED